MNMMTTIGRFTRMFCPLTSSNEDSHGGNDMRFSVNKRDPANTVVSYNEVVALMEKHHISYHPNLVAFIVDIEIAIRKHIAEQEQPQPPQQPKEQD